MRSNLWKLIICARANVLATAAFNRCSQSPAIRHILAHQHHRHHHRQAHTMTTATRLQLSPATNGLVHLPDIQPESAEAVNQVLQKNHDGHHIFFNEIGLHNHIVHHVLSIFASGADSSEIQKAFNDNKGTQRPLVGKDGELEADVADKATFLKYLGKEKYFRNYLTFFENEIDAKGWRAVVTEYMFARDPIAEAIFLRMYSGGYHPIIHLGYGIEFDQPAIIAEALAQAAVHSGGVGQDFLPAAEAEATQTPPNSTPSLVNLLHKIRADKKLRTSAQWSDNNKMTDGIFARAFPEIISLAAQWRVKPNELERRAAEMIEAAMYFAGAAQRPDKAIKIDFFHMHCVTSSLFFTIFIQQDWIATRDKIRLLEWKGRLDLAWYASRGAAELRIEDITAYTPTSSAGLGWEEMMRQVNGRVDDGHVSKFIRAARNGEIVCRPFEADVGDGFPIKGGMWLTLARMVFDSTLVRAGGEEPKWPANVGFAEAWEAVPARVAAGPEAGNGYRSNLA